MSRLSATFQRLKEEDRAGVAIYLTVGFPDPEVTVAAARAALAGGADILELGVPFSDPLADGATIQRSSSIALAQGVNMDTCLKVAAAIRAENETAPLLLMGYYNPFLQYGPERVAQAASDAGVDGLIIPDLPPEESDGLDASLRSQELDLVFLLAPTSTDERIEAVARRARGFIYCVSVTGVTGARSQISGDVGNLLERVRKFTKLPLALGFGISQPEHVERVAAVADAVIVGSAFVDLIDKTSPGKLEETVRDYVASLVSATKRTPDSTT